VTKAQLKQSEAASATLPLRVPKMPDSVRSRASRPLGHREPSWRFCCTSRSFSRSSSKKGTTAVKPTASSSAFVNPVTRLPLTRYSPSFPRTLTNGRRVTHCTDWLVGLHEASISAMDVALSGMSHIGHVRQKTASKSSADTSASFFVLDKFSLCSGVCAEALR